LKGGAKIAGLQPIARLVQTMEHLLEFMLNEGRLADDKLQTILYSAYERAFRIINILKQGSSYDQNLFMVADLISVMESYYVTGESNANAAHSNRHHEHSTPTSLDPELVSIFQEEARDLLAECDSALIQWRNHPKDFSPLETLKRHLHTLKGGARLAGLEEIGHYLHRLEDFLFAIQEKHVVNQAIQKSLAMSFDALMDTLDLLAGGEWNNVLLENSTQQLAAIDIENSENEDEVETLPIKVPHPDCDPELLQMFLQEGGEILLRLQQLFKHIPDNGERETWLTDVARYYHTMKGGARMSYLDALGEISHLSEEVLHEISKRSLPFNSVVLELYSESLRWMDLLLKDAYNGVFHSVNTEEIKLLLERFRSYLPKENSTTEKIEGLDLEALNLFLEEAKEIIKAIDTAYQRYIQKGQDKDFQEILRQLHTLKGGARISRLPPVADIAHALEGFLERTAKSSLPFAKDSEARDVFNKALEALFHIMEKLEQGKFSIDTESCGLLLSLLENYGADTPPLTNDLETFSAISTTESDLAEASDISFTPSSDPSVLEMFVEEAFDILRSCEEVFEQWLDAPGDTAPIIALQRPLHTLKGNARMVGLTLLADLTHALESYLLPLAEGRSQATQANLRQSQEALDMLNSLVEEAKVSGGLYHKPEYLAMLARLEGHEEIETTKVEAVATMDLPAADLPDDPETLAMFIEEGRDLTQALQKSLEAWQEEPTNKETIKEIQRHLHTLKGGARMAGLLSLGEFTHIVETMLLQFTDRDQVADSYALQLTQKSLDTINALLDRVKKSGRLQIAADEVRLQQQILSYPNLPAEDTAKSAAVPKAATPAIVQAAPMPKTAPASQATLPTSKNLNDNSAAKMAASKVAFSSNSARKQAKNTESRDEPIKVRAELIDKLVNNTGEVNIYHARIGEQITQFRFNLQEMERTVSRLREQLRRLEIETETQILSKHTDDASKYENFDPLEFDRFTSLQQVSRSLSESINDLMSLRGLMVEGVRSTETLLVQQNRITTDLQDGLIRTRMVKFEEKVQRFKRLLRQTCDFRSKKAELKVIGADSDVDRNLLERLVGPIEHLLRNAISHGIEEPEKRRQLGKPEIGQVTIQVGREGGEIVVRLGDDGAGIDTRRVLAKAIEKKLVEPNAKLTEKQIMYLLLASGFSTAEQVDQISGRGVGMDVVASEVKQLGGSLEIDSVLGKGATFTLRLPFTLAINRSLIVTVDDTDYAIPIANIEGLTRMKFEQLNQIYSQDEPKYIYANNEYLMRSLGYVLGSSPLPKPIQPDENGIIPGGNETRNIVMIRSGDIRMAFQVQATKGIQEVVVKNVGPQLAQVSGIAGATIMPDGSVILILEVNSLVRIAARSFKSSVLPVAAEAMAEGDIQVPEISKVERDVGHKPLVLIVDDSITIRRVTTKLLEKNHFRVISAKDGMDAVVALQEQSPDIALLDIEMPRMDGFELATHIRNQSSLRDMPLIMISSRTGQKHTDRAKEIGVNIFLGKPYQETQLVSAIHQLLKDPTYRSFPDTQSA
jgi:chemosensory pili system protein ChpA (sensor histidine kinase/response regulator)